MIFNEFNGLYSFVEIMMINYIVIVVLFFGASRNGLRRRETSQNGDKACAKKLQLFTFNLLFLYGRTFW